MKKLIAMLLAATLVLTVFAGCGKTEPAAEETTAAPAAEGTAPAIKIGVTGPLTGDNSEYGLAVRGGMEIAGAEINAKGGLQIDFKAEDD